MSKVVLMKINGVPIYWDESESLIEYTGELTVCADGARNCYGPEPPYGIDYLGNGGYPGNWWGVSCNSSGEPYIQKPGDPERWPFPGYYISMTAYEYSEYSTSDVRRWVDAAIVKFSVIPGNVRTAVPPKFLGCQAMIIDKKTGREMNGVCAEIGPGSHCGEASMAAAKHFGLSDNPKNGGSSDKKRWLYRFWPGKPAQGWKLI